MAFGDSMRRGNQSNLRFVVTGIVVGSLFIYVVFIHKWGSPEDTQTALKTSSGSDKSATLEFLPKQPYNHTCDELFIGTKAASFNFTANYRKSLPDYEAAIKRVTGGTYSGDGHIALFGEEHLALHYMASRDFVTNICETGFNYGHSSFAFLTANDKAVVHSFDIAHHSYTKPLAEYLSKAFPGRFFGHFGDSTVTVPEFIRDNPNHKCDFVFIDGGHIYPVAKADLENFRKITNQAQNLVAFDDYPTQQAYAKGSTHGKAWEDFIQGNQLKEYSRCHRKFDAIRGFTVGRFIYWLMF